MTVKELDRQLVNELAEIAEHQQRDINLVVREMIDDYRKNHPDDETFRQQVRQIMAKHATLLEMLAKS